MSNLITKEQAAKYLRELLYTVQKFRSIMDEMGIITNRPEEARHMTEAQASEVWKWVWGNNCLIKPLTQILDKYDETGELAASDFCNMIFVATHLEPMLAVVTLFQDKTFPQELPFEWYGGFK